MNKTWDELIELYADLLLLFFTVIMIIIFVLVFMYGAVKIYEDYKAILYFELFIMCPAILVIGIDRLVRDIKFMRRQK